MVMKGCALRVFLFISDDMSNEILMTQEGYDSVKKELDYLKNEKMPEIIQRIEDALKLGDLSENAEYQEAKEDQGITSAKIRELENKIHNAKIIEKSSGGPVSIGSRLTVVDETGATKEYEIVDQTQADPVAGKISNESPIGEAFMDRVEGDTVEVALPAGTKTFTIKSIS